jgi:hypothetical protein
MIVGGHFAAAEHRADSVRLYIVVVDETRCALRPSRDECAGLTDDRRHRPRGGGGRARSHAPAADRRVSRGEGSALPASVTLIRRVG